MSIYNRALSNAPQVDRRIVRAVDRVIRSLPTPGGVFGRDDVWSALQANAKEAGVPMDLDAVQVQKALDALCLACILTCRGGAYSEVAGVPPLKVEAPAVPADPPPVAEVEPAESDGLSPALAEVVTLLRERPMSSTQIRERLGATSSTITTRLSRLMLAGVVRKGAQIPRDSGGVPRYMYELAPPGTREVPSPAPVPEVAPPAPVKAEPWTARPKQEDEVLPALQALGQTETPPDHADLLAQFERFAASSVDATTPAEALAARVQGALRYIAEIEAEGRGLADLCNEAHSELDAAGAPDGTPAERVRWLVDQWNGTRDALDACDSLLTSVRNALRLAGYDAVQSYPNNEPVCGFVLPTDEQARRVAEEVVQLRAIVQRSEATETAIGPAWPSLRNLDVDRDEAAITAIERRCAAWRTLLAAAREVAT